MKKSDHWSLLEGLTIDHCPLQMDGVTVDVELGILRSELDYEVDARFMNHGPRGSVSGSLTHVVAHVTLNIQPGTEKVTLKELTVHEIGHLKAKITGLGSILNFLISRVRNIITIRPHVKYLP